MTGERDRSVDTARVPGGRVILLVDVDPAALNARQQRALDLARGALMVLTAPAPTPVPTPEPSQRRSEPSNPAPGPLTPETPRKSPQHALSDQQRAAMSWRPGAWTARGDPDRRPGGLRAVPGPLTSPEAHQARSGPLSAHNDHP